MKVNIENCINQICSYMKTDPSAYKYTIGEFINNLKNVKKAHEDGRSKEVLDEFFRIFSQLKI